MNVGSAAWIAWMSAARAGTLAGLVSTSDGAPVEGADVTVYGPDALGTATAATGPDGRWQVDGLTDGRYRVVAVPPEDSDDAETWAPSAADRCAGDGYDVVGGDVTTADVTLLPGAELTGSLLLPDGMPAVGAVVTVTPETDAAERTATTGDDGAFVVRGLPPVGATLTFDALETPVQYWGGAFDDRDAWVLSVGLDRPAEVGAVQLLEGAVLAGTVTGPLGPLTLGDVVLQSAGQRITAAIGLDGTWESDRLPPGTVLVSANVPGHAQTWWPDADHPGERVEVEIGERVDEIDLLLPAEARVRGTLAHGPWHADGAILVLHNDDDTLLLGALVDEAGAFQYTRLPPGDYTLYVDGTSNDRLAGFLADDAGDPLPIVVPPGEVVELGDLELPPAGRVEGTVTDAATGAPVVGAYVVAKPTTEDAEELTAVTDVHGWFAVRGLTEGPWELRAGYASTCPTDHEWVTVWHPATPNDLFTSLVDVVPGEVATWSVRLPPDDDHDAMDDEWEVEHRLDPTVDDAEEDPDDDGFDNLAEYLLDTDPTDRPRKDEGCGCASGAGGSPLAALALVPLFRRRRARPPTCTTGSGWPSSGSR